MYLRESNLKAAAAFLESPLWADFKRCLAARKQAEANVDDPSTTAAHKGFKRDGFDDCISEIEKIPFDIAPVVADPFQRPALDTKD